MSELTADVLLRAYAYGVFPMAEDSTSQELFWIDPEERGILPLDAFHLPRRLRKTVRQNPFTIRVDTAFRQVMEACAASRPGREGTWINDQILSLYTELHEKGFAHSVECWQGGKLVGGLYGVRLGAAFFGESMFSEVKDASKVALVHLVARLRHGGFLLLDTQFVTDHLAQFGAVEIPRADYKLLLQRAVTQQGDFYSLPLDAPPELVLQSVSQTS